MIVITAPTGSMGSHAATKLVTMNKPVRVIARDPGKLSDAIRNGSEVIQGSHGDAETIDRALQGAEALFWLAPMNPRGTLEEGYIDFTRPAAEAIKRHGIKRVVNVSTLGRGTPWEDKAGIPSMLKKMDDMLAATGAACRSMALPSFMDNYLRQIPLIKTRQVIAAPTDPDKALPLIATGDIGKLAADWLADSSWSDSETIPVVGPESLTGPQVAEIISEVLDQTITYQHMPFEMLEKQQLDMGVNKSFVDGYIMMMRAKNEGLDDLPSDRAIVTTETSFRTWCTQVLKPALQNLG